MSWRTGFSAFAQSRRTRPFCVVARERREVDAGDRSEEPGGLELLLDRPPAGKGRRAALDRGGVGLHGPDPVEVERKARVSGLMHLRQVTGHGGMGTCLDVGWHDAGLDRWERTKRRTRQGSPQVVQAPRLASDEAELPDRGLTALAALEISRKHVTVECPDRQAQASVLALTTDEIPDLALRHGTDLLRQPAVPGFQVIHLFPRFTWRDARRFAPLPQ